MKIVIVANKWWEAAPLVSVLQHVRPNQRHLSAVPSELYGAGRPASTASLPVPRLSLQWSGTSIDVWCVQDLMDPLENSSLTWEKGRVLGHIVSRGGGESLVVIAFGTAASPVDNSNGNVIIGTSVFVHDPFANAQGSQKHWTHPELNRVVPSDLQSRFDEISLGFVEEAERRMLTPPLSPASTPHIKVSSRLVSVGVVNVLNSADYAWADNQALVAFRSSGSGMDVESLETTHGVIRLVLGGSFIYVSGITNGVGKFAQEVTPRGYSQTLVAAHNAAVAVSWLIPELVSAIANGK